MRWEHETTAAAENLGWRVVATNGVDDYQGWGVHLLQRYGDGLTPSEWGVLSWSYGSCSGCDQYEDEIPYGLDDAAFNEKCVQLFGPLIETCKDEEDARMKFSERKGW